MISNQTKAELVKLVNIYWENVVDYFIRSCLNIFLYMFITLNWERGAAYFSNLKIKNYVINIVLYIYDNNPTIILFNYNLICWLIGLICHFEIFITN